MVALVGYTNAGKSTLFNRLTGSGVLAKDMLFATLDPTMRAIALPDGRKAILSDTVGFISDLPTQLVAAFRATLEEVLEADLILHVRDIAHAESEIQAENVRAILAEMGIAQDEQQARMIEVWNKIDALAPERAEALRQIAARTPRVAAVSALTGEGVPALLDLVAGELAEPMQEETISLRFDQGRQRAWLFDRKLVRAEHPREDGYDLDVRWTDRDRSQYEALRLEPVNLCRPRTGRIRVVHELCMRVHLRNRALTCIAGSESIRASHADSARPASRACHPVAEPRPLPLGELPRGSHRRRRRLRKADLAGQVGTKLRRANSLRRRPRPIARRRAPRRARLASSMA